jgi:hypothetical protein
MGNDVRNTVQDTGRIQKKSNKIKCDLFLHTQSELESRIIKFVTKRWEKES